MTFKEKLQSIFTKKNLDPKESKSWDKEIWAGVDKSYEEAYGQSLGEAMAEDKQNSKKAETYDAISGILSETEEEVNVTNGEEKPESKTNKPQDLTQKVEAMASENKELKGKQAELEETINQLSSKLEEDKPKVVVLGKNLPLQKAHTESHAFGIEHEMYSLDKRWNKIAANPAFSKAHPVTAINDESKIKKSFANELTNFGSMIASRYFELKEQNLLGQIKNASFDVDYTELESQFKNQYVVRRLDALIAQILMSKSISSMFPVRSGVQDMDVITNVLFSEVSSAWQKGKIFKGSADLQPEYGHVDDASIKVLFEPLTEMERQYIGYLNTEGSDPVKMSMIEWYAMNLLTQAITEKYRRAVRGIYFKPETGVSGHYLNAATGILHTLIRYTNQFKLLAHEDAAYRSYTDATMFDTVKAWLKKVQEDLLDQEIEDYTLVLNLRHKSWFIDNLRDTFGQDTDFKGPQSYANIFPDYNVPIYWLPNMLQTDFTMILTKPGNIQQIENVPGEMMALVFQDDFEDITVRSRFKEGISAAFVGPKFADKASLVSNNFVNQHIYMNKSVVALSADETEPDAASGYRFLTVANGGATAITDIANKKQGEGYYIECGSLTYASTIAQAGNFAGITAAFTPTAVGDYILVSLNNAGDDFFELERMVGGVRSVNATLQPTLPEARS